MSKVKSYQSPPDLLKFTPFFKEEGGILTAWRFRTAEIEISEAKPAHFPKNASCLFKGKQ